MDVFPRDADPVLPCDVTGTPCVERTAVHEQTDGSRNGGCRGVVGDDVDLPAVAVGAVDPELVLDRVAAQLLLADVDVHPCGAVLLDRRGELVGGVELQWRVGQGEVRIAVPALVGRRAEERGVEADRLRLLSLVASAPAGEVCACDLPGLVDRSQPTVSHHLSVLADAGLITREQRGRWAWFAPVPSRIVELADVLR